MEDQVVVIPVFSMCHKILDCLWALCCKQVTVQLAHTCVDDCFGRKSVLFDLFLDVRWLSYSLVEVIAALLSVEQRFAACHQVKARFFEGCADQGGVGHQLRTGLVMHAERS